MRKSRILVVEDDFDIAEAMSDVLTDQGHWVQTARNGEEALVTLSVGALPQLIFLDLMMPLMDGAEFRAAQLQDLRISQIPVILLSASSNLAARALELTVAGWLVKPITPQNILDAAERYALSA